MGATDAPAAAKKEKKTGPESMSGCCSRGCCRTACFVVSVSLAGIWVIVMTAMVASLSIQQREHATALGFICSKPRKGVLSVVPFIKQRGQCEKVDKGLPPALQKALPFLKPLKNRLLHLPLIGTAATYLLRLLPITGPWLHFVGVSLSRYILPLAKKIDAVFLVLKLRRDGEAWKTLVATAKRMSGVPQAALSWLRRVLGLSIAKLPAAATKGKIAVGSRLKS